MVNDALVISTYTITLLYYFLSLRYTLSNGSVCFGWSEPHPFIKQYNFVLGRRHMHKSKVNPVHRLVDINSIFQPAEAKEWGG